MNLVLIASGLIAAALLLGACQAASSGAAGQSQTVQQSLEGDLGAKHHQRCCRRAGRNGQN